VRILRSTSRFFRRLRDRNDGFVAFRWPTAWSCSCELRGRPPIS